ncbi:glycosyltransferase [Synechococcus sp. PCC 7336]|uniref:glycosyltransferase family 2 protein n=1 Tax=Synechococcus sp. PCC 7336 TaxID=195250 RepID=UPI000345A9E5|nr:glycosyltransferase [Synechococcus sp. PCC 7336]
MSRTRWLPWLDKASLLLAAAFLLAFILVRVSGPDLAANAFLFWQTIQQLFVPQEVTWQGLLLPTIVSVASICSFKLLTVKPETVCSRAIVASVMIFLGVRYILWRGTQSLNLSDPLTGGLSLLLFFMELVTFLNTIIFFLQTLPRVDRTSEADRGELLVRSGKYRPWVDILIPTYNEPPELLRRTIMGCQALDYPRKRIYLLDDLRRPHIRQLAYDLKCYYLDRPDNRHAKAGNVNHALQYVDGELIVIFDADFVPKQNFLNRTVGFFADRDVALLQTPQHFYNDDPITEDLGLQGVLNNEQSLFFRYIQPSRDATNSLVCCGTSFVIRRSALDRIGGIPTESIAEDFFTSVKLQSLGYQTKYLNEAISAGMSPENISAYINQRLRWGRGTIQALFCDTNMFTLPGLTLWQRMTHAWGVLYWFLCIPRLIFLVMPLTFLLFGLVPIRATVVDIAYFYLPFYLGNILIFGWLTDGRRSVFWADVYETLICVPMALTVLNTLVQPFGKGFKVTPKGVASNKIRPNWGLIGPLLCLMGLYAGGILYRIVNLVWSSGSYESVAVNIVWSIYSLALLQICILAAIDVPQRSYPRFDKALDCKLDCDRFTISGLTVNLSEAGAAVTVSSERSLDAIPDRVTLTFPTIAGPFSAIAPIQAKIRWRSFEAEKQQYRLGLEFVHLSETQLRQAIELLYCDPEPWTDCKIPEHVTSWAFFRSIFRLYSLAETR